MSYTKEKIENEIAVKSWYEGWEDPTGAPTYLLKHKTLWETWREAESMWHEAKGAGIPPHVERQVKSAAWHMGQAGTSSVLVAANAMIAEMDRLIGEK